MYVTDNKINDMNTVWKLDYFVISWLWVYQIQVTHHVYQGKENFGMGTGDNGGFSENMCSGNLSLNTALRYACSTVYIMI